jgi:alkylation response protein AidB-like acyl-CoA dehydrogenase
MDFSFSSEQTQLADTLGRYLTQQYDFESRKKIVYSPEGWSAAAYTQIAELGVMALGMPEEADGFGGSTQDLILVMQELGKNLVVEPVIATLVAAEFIKRSTLKARIDTLKKVADGSLKLAAALTEAQSRYDLFDVVTSAKEAGGSYTLTGTKPVVVHGAQADALVVSARVSGDSRERDGLALFLVPSDAAGLSRSDVRTIDGQRAATVKLNNVKLGAENLIASGKEAAQLLDVVGDFGVALVCSEAVGLMDRLLALTADYTKTRKQFGQPIAKFQALQHRMVDMFMHVEQARSMAYLAAVKADSSDAAERRRSVSAAKVRIGQAAKFVGQQAVQLHGGMGVTNEMPAAHYFKRLTMLEVTMGDSDFHLQRFVAETQQEPVRVALKAAA